MEYLELIKIEKEEIINIRHLFPNSQRATGKKTIISINTNFIQNYKLIKKENCNEYSITSNINGESFSVSWSKL